MLDRARGRIPDRPAASEEYINYSDIVQFLKRYWLTIAAGTSLSTVVAVVYLLTAHPIFTARAQILIDPFMPGVTRERIGETFISLDSSQIESQIAVLRSEELAAKVVRSLNLVDAPEFQPSEPSALSQAIHSVWLRVRRIVSDSVAKAEVPLTPAAETRRSNSSEVDDIDLRIARAILLDNLDVRRVGMSYAIDVSFSSRNPDTAAEVANAIAESYIAEQIATQAQAARQGSDWLRERIDQIKQQMNEANLRVQEFKARRDYRIVSRRDRLGDPDDGSSDQAQTARANSEVTTLEALESTAQTYRKIYEKFLEAFAEAVQRQSFPVANARIITRATQPLGKSHPKTKLVLALGIVIGAMAGCGIALLRNSMDGSVRSPRQIREALGIECLGQVPQLSQKDSQRALAIVTTAPFSRFSDGMKRVKTAISLAGKTHPIRTLGVVSSRSGEGKSTITSNLAELFANSDRRVLLIDADIRNPTLSRALAPQAEAGLMEVLNGMGTAAPCTVRLNGGLDILPAASKEPVANSADLLGSEMMRRLLHDLAQTYDLVVLDLPPLNGLADGLALSPLLDAVILLAEWGETPMHLVEEAVYSLSAAQASVLGVVITKVSPKAMDTTGSRSHSYYY